MKNKISVFISIVVLGISNSSHSKPLFQAGDIAEGLPHVLTKESGVASYYKKGRDGQVKFNCEFQGEGAKAIVYGGKNFRLNVPHTLHIGSNGMYIYTLHNFGDDEGNIKIKLIEGNQATIQCVEVE